MGATKQASEAFVPRAEFDAALAMLNEVKAELDTLTEIKTRRAERRQMAQEIERAQRAQRFRTAFLAASPDERAAILDRLRTSRPSTDSDHQHIARWYGTGRPLSLIAEAAAGLAPRAREMLYELAHVAPPDRRQVEYGLAPTVPTVAFVLAGSDNAGARMERLPLAQVSDDEAAELREVGLEVNRSGGVEYRAAIEIGWVATEILWPRSRFDALHRTCPKFREMVRSFRELEHGDPKCLREGAIS